MTVVGLAVLLVSLAPKDMECIAGVGTQPLENISKARRCVLIHKVLSVRTDEAKLDRQSTATILYPLPLLPST